MLVQIVTENGQKKVIPLTADAGSGVSLGMIVPFFVKRERSGYLFCDGSRFDKTKYPLLYAELGTDILPDCREVGLTGAEKNTTYIFDSTETDPRTGQAGTQNHDVFTQGEFKDDQLQDHTHKYTITADSWSGTQGSSTRNLYTQATGITQGVNGARTGTVTRGKSLAVYWYIKATSGLSENAQDNVVAQLNEERSYSTSEVNTGAKWIDGKPIYRKVVDFGYLPNNVSKTVAHGISGISSVIQTYGIIRNTRLDYWLPLPFSSKTSTNVVGLSIVGSNIQITTGADRTEETAIVILEYTKTTD